MMLRQLFDLLRYSELIKALVSRDLKVRYKNSILGYVWTWLDPLMTMLVFILVFDVILQMKVENFPVYLLAGLIPWTFFSNAIGGSVSAITGNAALIKRVYYPREIFPLTTLLSEGVNTALSLLVLIPVILFFGIPITVQVLLLPVALLLLFLFTYGICLLCSTMNVFFRDMRYIIPFTLRLWFFMTPIFWTLDRFKGEDSGPLLDIYMTLNPMAVILSIFRTSLMGHALPGAKYLAACVCWCLVTFTIGYLVFKKAEDFMVKRI